MDIKEFIVLAEMPEVDTVPKGSVDTSEKAQAHRIGKINDYSRVKEKRKKEEDKSDEQSFLEDP